MDNNLEIRNISFNIFAGDDKEAEIGKNAIVQFINIMGQQGAKVSGYKLHQAVKLLNTNPFITSQIIQFFKKQ